MSIRARFLVGAALVLGLIGASLLFLLDRRAPADERVEQAGGSAPAPPVSAAAAPRATAPANAVSAGSAGGVGAERTPAATRPSPGVAPRGEARQAELLDTIRRARGEEGAPPVAAVTRDGGTALGAEEIRGAIRALQPKLHECYESRLKEKEGLAGTLVAKFTIVAKEGKGTIDEGEIKKSTLGDLRLETCMLHALTTARFPMPRGEGRVTVNYPFRFRAN